MTVVTLVKCDACEAEARSGEDVGWTMVTVSKRKEDPGEESIRDFDLCPSCTTRWDIL